MLASGLVVAVVALAAGSLSAEPTGLSFGAQDIDDDATTAQASTITNAGPDPVAITGVAIDAGPDDDQFAVDSQPGDCTTATVLAADESCTVHATFDPTTTGSKSATLRVTSIDGGDAVVALDGEGTQTRVTASETSLSFGSWDVDDGPVGPETVTLENAGTEPVDVQTLAISGGEAADFGFVSPAAGSDCTTTTTLDAGDTCDVRVVFDPTVTGARAAQLDIVTTADDFAIALDGTGTQTEVTASPDTLSFGDRDIDDGATAQQVSVITNTGTETVTPTGVTIGGADAADFQQLTDQGSDCAATASLGPNDTCNVRVRFDPASAGLKSATVTYDSNAPDETIALSGTGTQTELSSDEATLTFGSQDVDDGPTAEQTATITNSGTEPVDLDAVTMTGDTGDFDRAVDDAADCTADTSLLSGETCTVRVTFDPDTTGPKAATVTVESNAPDVAIGLDGSGIQTELTATPDSLDLGSQDVDDGPTLADTSVVQNSGTETVTITSIAFGGDDAGDFGRPAPGTGDCVAGTVLAAGDTCDVDVRFDPSTTGGKTATLTIASNAPDETIALSGTGTQTQLTPSPATLPFGNQEIDGGPTATQESIVQNTGTEQVSIVAVTGSGDTSQFERLTGQGTDCSGTTTLNAGETCKIRVRFDPTTTGGKTATYTIDSNAPDVSVTATGTGTLTQITANPDTVPFGTQDVDAGPTADQTSTVENTGTQTVTIAAITLGGANPKQFRVLNGTPTDCAVSTALAPDETCEVRAIFDPSFKGAKSATITIDSNAPDETISLAGTAVESVFEPSDDPLDEAHVTNGQVNAVAFDASGRAYLGGTFTYVGPRTGHGAALTQSSDDPDPDFPDVNGSIRAIAPDGSGGWFIGGDFTSVGGTPRSRLAHITSGGALDAGWDPVADGRVNTLAFFSGSVFVGGEFATIDGVERTFAAKLSATTGEVGPIWHPIVNNKVSAIVADGSGVYLGGDFTQVNATDRNRLARVSAAGAGALDTAWDPDANNSVAALALSGTGDVYAGGAFTIVDGVGRDRIAKLDPTTGAADLAWNPGANNTVSTLTVDGADVYAGGAFTTIGGVSRNRLAKLTASSGTVDATFLPNPDAPVHAIAVSGSSLYAGGEFTAIGGQPRSRLARVSTTSGLADAWDPSANNTARALAVAGSAVYVGGDFTSVGATARSRLARLEPDGTLDADWNPSANNTVSALVVSGSDVYVGGSFTSAGGQTRNRIAKLSTTGNAADPAWDPGATGSVTALAVSGTTVYAGGLFLNIDGQARNRLARLTGASGDLDTAWLPAGASGQVNALALSGGDLFAGGAFLSIGGQPRDRIAKLAAAGTGTVDPGWNPGASNTVTALALNGADLYAGGFFTTIASTPRNFVAALDTATGAVDAAWDPDANGPVRAIAPSATDVYLGGDFTQVSGQPHNRLAKLPQDGDGAADAGWDPAVAGGSVLSLAVSGDRLAAGGSFTSVGGQSSQGFALLELPTLEAEPGGLAFGEQDVDDGPTAVQTSTITNPRATPVTISAVTLGGADASDFAHVTDDPGDCAAGTVLEEDETCTVRAMFDPTSSGAKAAEIAVTSDSPGIEVALTGVGADTELSPDPASLSFGDRDVDDGPTDDQTSTITNAGTEQIDFSDIVLEGSAADQFEVLSDEVGDCLDTTILQPGQTCALRVRFDPTTMGTKSASATIESNATEMSVALSGNGIQTELSRSPTSLAFGSQDIDDGATATQESTVTNSGTETVTLTTIDDTGDASHLVRLTGAGTDCAAGTVLAAGETCKVRMQFDPSTVGAKAATVTIHSNAADITVTASGTGTQTLLSQDPATLPFGAKDIDDGATAAQGSVIANVGTETVTIAALTFGGPDDGDFERLTDEPTDCAVGTQLEAGETCNVRARFDPSAVGAKSASLTVDSNAPDVTISLSGTGIQTELSRSPTSLAFGSRDIDDGPTAVQTSTVTNSGTETVDLDAVTVGGTNPSAFNQLTDQLSDCTESTTLASGATCDLRLQFDPTTVGPKSATVTVDSNAADVSVTLTGTGIQTLLTRSPATLAFGNQNINDGATAAQESTVTNAGTETVTFTAIEFTGDTTQFSRLSGQPADCTGTTTLAAGETCKLRAEFDPTTTGAKAAALTVKSNAADVAVALTGTGVLTQLQRSATTLAFGSQDVDDGVTAAQTSTITNTGSETVMFTSISTTGDTTQFVRLTDQPSTDCSDSTVLTAGQTCEVRVQFDPTTTGPKSASITIASNAADQTISLTGTGTQTTLGTSPATLPFGSQDVNEGATAAQESTVTNTGTEPVTIVAVNESGDTEGSFERLTGEGTDCGASTTLNAGDTCKIRVRFDPAGEGISESATYTVDSNAPDVTVTATGLGILKELSAGSATLTYGSKDVDDGATAAQTSTITNSGDQSITLATVSLTGDTGHFARLTDAASDCAAGDVLAPGDTCDVRAEFDPSTVGAKAATVTIDSNAPDVAVALSGTGIQTELSRSPTSLSFGSRDIDEGPTAVQESTVTNTGTESVDLASVSIGGTDPAHFEQLTDEATDCDADTVLAATETCKLRLRFDPSSMGAKAATVTVGSNAADVAVSLSGTGIQTALSRSPDTLSFGARDIDDGATTVQTSTVTNSGSETVDLGGVTVTGDDSHFVRLTDQGTDCTADTSLTAGQTCEVRIRFDPSTVGAKAATVTVESNAADVTVALSGTATQTQLTAAPDALAFGSKDVDDGATATQTSTVTNTGTEPVTIAAVAQSGDTDDFVREVASGECAVALVLTAGQTCTVRLNFDPATTGAKSFSLTLDSDAPDEAVSATGTGIQTELSRSPTSLSFGARDIDDGATAVQTATITNAGTETVDLDAITLGGSDPGQFERLTDQGTDCTAATTLAAGQTCALRLRFDPTTVGAKAATVTVDSNAADVTMSLSGTGIQTELSRSPTSLSFGSKDVDDGATAVQTSTVTNAGTETVDLDAVTVGGTDPGQFARLTGQGTDCTAATTLGAGQTCEVRLRFDPSSVGAKAATVTVESNAADVTVSVSGTGIQTELTRAPTALAFGSRDIDDGPTPTQESTVTNSGTETVTLASVTTTGQFERLASQATDCGAGDALAAGETCKVRVRFEPSTTGAKTGTVTVDSNAADVVVDLSGTGTQTLLAISPGSLSFGEREVDNGPTAAQESTVTNTGSEAVDLDAVTLGGSDPGQFERLTGQAGDCSAATTLGAGDTCKVRVRFDPSARGAQDATVTVESNAADVIAALSGTGIDTELTAAPTSLAFGSRDIDAGPSATQTSTIANTGTEPVTFTSAALTGPNAGDYTRPTGGAGDCGSSTSLAPGESCDVRVRFDPATNGAKPSSFAVASNAPAVAVTLSGTGVRTVIARTPAALDFEAQDIDDGATATQDATIQNKGTEPVTLSAVVVRGRDAARFEVVGGQPADCAAGDVLAADETCTVRARFDPAATGDHAARVDVEAEAPAADVSIDLTGEGIQTELSRNPGDLAFGAIDVDDGATGAQSSTVTNTGTDPVRIDALNLGGAEAGDFERLSGQSSDCEPGRTLNAGESCGVRARFDASDTGARSATLTVDSSAADVGVALAGTGTQTAVAMGPPSLGFGARNIEDGAGPPQAATVLNTGTEPVTLTGVVVAGPSAADFVRQTGAPADCAVGSVLGAGEACAARVAFDPVTVGDKAAAVRVTSTAGEVSTALAGTGVVTLTVEPVRLVLGRGPTRARQTNRRRFRVQLSAIGGVVPRVTLTLSKASGGRIRRMTVRNVGPRRTVTFRLRRKLRPGRYTVTATGPAATAAQVSSAQRTYRLR
ncbi:MAG TPA: choice-of-anchor D domain-containing protein [Solirubrobacteraceae bacterium]